MRHKGEARGTQVRPVNYHDHGPTVALYLPWRDFLDQKKCYVEYYGVYKAFCKPKDDSFGRSIAFGETKSMSKVSVPVRAKCCPFHGGSSPMQSNWCHDGGLVLLSMAGRLGTQQQLQPRWLWREVHIVELIHNLNINWGLAFPFFEKKIIGIFIGIAFGSVECFGTCCHLNNIKVF